MLDIKLIRKDPELVEKKLRTKVSDVDLGKVLSLDELIREKKTFVEHLKAQRNAASEKIGRLKREGQSVDALMQEVASFADEIHSTDQELRELEADYLTALASLPNIPADDIKISADPKDNVVVKEFGQKREFTFAFRNHLELSELHNLFDFKRGAKLAGSGWIAYRGLGARLEWALLNYMLNLHVQAGYEQWMPPVVVKKEMMFGAGQLPKFEGQQYALQGEGEGLYLIPTAEVALNGLYSDEILSEEELPKRCVAYTPCFRREAGAAGERERGLIRMHQFNKVEMFAFTTPEQSAAMFDEMVRRAELVLEGLELHYRTMLLVTGDMSFAATRTIDVEVYLPGQERYYEVSSISNCEEYQARRANTRCVNRVGEVKKPRFLHTLNGSGLATSRLMVAILENNQLEDGTIVIPKVLRPYMNGLEKLTP